MSNIQGVQSERSYWTWEGPRGTSQVGLNTNVPPLDLQMEYSVHLWTQSPYEDSSLSIGESWQLDSALCRFSGSGWIKGELSLKASRFNTQTGFHTVKTTSSRDYRRVSSLSQKDSGLSVSDCWSSLTADSGAECAEGLLMRIMNQLSWWKRKKNWRKVWTSQRAEKQITECTSPPSVSHPRVVDVSKTGLGHSAVLLEITKCCDV